MSPASRPASIDTKEDFNRLVAATKGREEYEPPFAWGLGIATTSQVDGKSVALDTHFLTVNFFDNYGAYAAILDALLAVGVDLSTWDGLLSPEVLGSALANFKPFWGEEGHKNVDAINLLRSLMMSSMVYRFRPVLVVIPDFDVPPSSLMDVYLRLHLLSHRHVQPNTINLDGIFQFLPNIVWTDQGPILASSFEEAKWQALTLGKPLQVRGVDKFPFMTDYVVPSGVRIADASRVRLGAYLAEGTTVMQAGFVNFNAGTLGPCMVEGRISQGVTVGIEGGEKSDIGGGASIMGTLSGGGEEVITVGEGCLLGANAGIGISLGDYCKVEAGLYLTARTLVTVFDISDFGVDPVPAAQLSGRSGLTYYRHGVTGRVEARPTKIDGKSFTNDMLHAHN